MSDEISHNRRVEISPKVIRTQFATVHADKILAAIDRSTNTVTLTLLVMHPKPQAGLKEWTFAELDWEVVAEIKVPLPVMDLLVAYYVQEVSNGLNIIPLVQENLRKHPTPSIEGIAYGPTKIEHKMVRMESENTK